MSVNNLSDHLSQRPRAGRQKQGFPRQLKFKQSSYRLVLIRRIPSYPAAAIYCSQPIFNRGKLVQDFLVLDAKLGILSQTSELNLALQDLFRLQQTRPAKRPLNVFKLYSSS